MMQAYKHILPEILTWAFSDFGFEIISRWFFWTDLDQNTILWSVDVNGVSYRQKSILVIYGFCYKILYATTVSHDQENQNIVWYLNHLNNYDNLNNYVKVHKSWNQK